MIRALRCEDCYAHVPADGNLSVKDMAECTACYSWYAKEGMTSFGGFALCRLCTTYELSWVLELAFLSEPTLGRRLLEKLRAAVFAGGKNPAETMSRVNTILSTEAGGDRWRAILAKNPLWKNCMGRHKCPIPKASVTRLPSWLQGLWVSSHHAIYALELSHWDEAIVAGINKTAHESLKSMVRNILLPSSCTSRKSLF